MATRRPPAAASPAPDSASSNPAAAAAAPIPARTTLLRSTGPVRHAENPKTAQVRIIGAGRRVEVNATARAASAGAADVPVRADELVRVLYDHDVVRWVRYDDLMREQGRKLPAARGAAGEPVWEFDAVPRNAEQAPAERGALSFGIQALEFFDVDVTGATALALCRTFERHQLGREPGLYRVAVKEADGPAALTKAEPAQVKPGRPVLLFLHGTASQFGGGFKHLFEPLAGEAGEPARQLRRQMRQRYGDEVYAWEHRSLSESPIRNVWNLVKDLPEGVQLHLVSHSRGGLLGELLTLGQRDRVDDALAGPLLPLLFEQDGTPAQAMGLRELSAQEEAERREAYAADLALMRPLLKALDDKALQVQRFVRVACPARGTTLASGRLDKWFSWLNALMPDNLFGDVIDFMLKVVKERTDPRTLPGLEAMMPGSGLTNLLRLPGLTTRADLSVIAGDTEPSGFFGRLKMLALDAFYGAEHDLVVNTGSMYGGVARVAGQGRFRFAAGAEVNHFHYFRNADSVQWLAAGLARAEGDAAGFLPLQEAKLEEPRWRSAVRSANAQTAPRPVVVVVPGTMGSALEAGGSRVWLHYPRLLVGGLGRIAMGQGDVDPVDLLDDFYGPLLEHLTRTHKVLICPYDWRHSVRDAARRLTAKVNEALALAESHGQPVHIVAHSMGGLVARAMAADGAEGAQAWRRMKALPGSRLLMLGTPNRGSYEAVRWLTGFNPTQTKLALLDMTRSTLGVIDIVRQYPGLAELLPWDDEPNRWGTANTWRALKVELGAAWTPIEDSVLRQAVTTWKMLGAAAPEPKHMVYVAGCQDATVIGYQLEVDDFDTQRKELRWQATREGDGTVPWASGRLSGVPMYYAPATSHDELCSNTDDSAIFRGYVDILQTGKTNQLGMSPPAGARAAGASTTFLLPTLPVVDDVPDAASRGALGLGGATTRRARKGSAPSAVLQVSVRHGDLSYARFPVLVGHYQGDTIVSAERVLDRRLRGDQPLGPLSRKRELGRYPGEPGSWAVFFNDTLGHMPEAALVVGLGQVGELTPRRLETGVRDTLLEYALTLLDRKKLEAAEATPKRVGLRVSGLLVGTGASSLDVRESVEALVRGALAANRKLEESKLDQLVLIEQLELLELFEDIAINAAHELAGLMKSAEIGPFVQWPQRALERGQGGRQRSRMSVDTAWWQRLEITEDKDNERLRFVATADRARAEETLALGQLRLADSFIAKASASTQAQGDVAKTLFEMLLPQRFKESAPDQRQMVLLLDEGSARFPWELLENRWSPLGKPQSVVSGMVRQLKTAVFRDQVIHTTDNAVYVVGNPNLSGWDAFPDLPGARREAEGVDTLFRAQGFASVASIDAEATQILAGLHARPWKVLHLAGHGEHEYEFTETDPNATTVLLPAGGRAVVPPKVKLADGREAVPIARTRRMSGMVIGRETFLTPGDIAQMRQVPELVFINCCHLGNTQPRQTTFNQLAANLGVEFIRMGVRAVVCAGWAVDDTAALTFAQSFYRELLGGRSFGTAVTRAREDTWVKHPRTNTWGAYQCYGDPGYRLMRDAGIVNRLPPADFFAPSELLIEAHNLMAELGMGGNVAVGAAAQNVRDRLEALTQRIPHTLRHDQPGGWLGRADVCAAFGFTFGEAGMFEDAVPWFERAQKSDEGDCPLEVSGRAANYRIRLAMDEWNKHRGTEHDSAAKRQGIAQTMAGALEVLTVLERHGSTAEHRRLMGSAYKRLAWAGTGTERTGALLQMTAFYREAYDGAQRDNAYAFSNWACGCLLLERADAQYQGGGWHDALRKLCEQQMASNDAANKRDPEFWKEAGAGDLKVVELLMAGDDAAAVTRAFNQATAAYQRAMKRGGGTGSLASVREHLEFLRDLMDEGVQPWPKVALDAVDGLVALVR